MFLGWGLVACRQLAPLYTSDSPLGYGPAAWVICGMDGRGVYRGVLGGVQIQKSE
jgi:hypothetical protein